jgi:hypothetical protein
MNLVKFNKQPWRLRTFQSMRSESRLWDGFKLRGIYAEMTALSGHEMYLILKEHKALEKPYYFVGSDLNVKVYVELREDKERGKIPWTVAFGDIIQVVQQIIHNKDGLPVAVLNMDGFDQVGGSKWWSETASPLVEIVEDSVRRLGSFMLILNKTLDTRTKSDPLEALRTQTALLCKVFGKRWPLSHSDIVTDIPPEVANRSFVGDVGAFQIYKSKGRQLRMATLRLAFQPRRIVAKLS